MDLDPAVISAKAVRARLIEAMDYLCQDALEEYEDLNLLRSEISKALPSLSAIADSRSRRRLDPPVECVCYKSQTD